MQWFFLKKLRLVWTFSELRVDTMAVETNLELQDDYFMRLLKIEFECDNR